MALDVIATTVFSYDTEVFNADKSVFIDKITAVLDTLDPERCDAVGKLRLFTAGARRRGGEG